MFEVEDFGDAMPQELRDREAQMREDIASRQ
jgi:hypothetical protein